MDVYLIDGTYELFRHFYAMPSAREADGREVGAVRGVLASLLGMINGGTTHIGVATDHVIESFRNQLWPGYKTGAGIDPDLYAQFPLLEEALIALGVAVWPMVEFEADDALAAAAAAAAARPARRSRDHLHAGQGSRAVRCAARASCSWIGARGPIRDEAGVIAKFGVPPASIPDYLALVGDTVRRLSRTAWLGRQIGGSRAGEVRPPRIDSRRLAHVGRERQSSGRAGARHSNAIATASCCSATSRRSGTTSRCSTRSTS